MALPPMFLPDNDPSEAFSQAGYSPAELRRQLHNASTTLSIAEVSTSIEIRERALFFARGKLAGILGKLDHLMAMVAAERVLLAAGTPSAELSPITPITTNGARAVRTPTTAEGHATRVGHG